MVSMYKVSMYKVSSIRFLCTRFLCTRFLLIRFLLIRFLCTRFLFIRFLCRSVRAICDNDSIADLAEVTIRSDSNMQSSCISNMPHSDFTSNVSMQGITITRDHAIKLYIKRAAIRFQKRGNEAKRMDHTRSSFESNMPQSDFTSDVTMHGVTIICNQAFCSAYLHQNADVCISRKRKVMVWCGHTEKVEFRRNVVERGVKKQESEE